MTELFSPPIPKNTDDRVQFGDLKGASQSMAIAACAQKATAPILIISPTSQIAAQTERELKAILPKDFPLWHFPDWETLPYDNFSPHQDIISERLTVLSQCGQLKSGILIVPLTTLLHRIAPKTFIQGQCLNLKTKMHFDWQHIQDELKQAGYQGVSQVMSHGEFATRGSIIDIFPMGSKQPIRIDLDDDVIDTIRLFDPESQRSDQKITELTCLPAHEFPLNPEAISLFRQNWRQLFSGDPSDCALYQHISEGTPSQGIEYYLPLFFEETASLFDYLPKDTLIVRSQALQKACTQFWKEVNERYEQYRHDRMRPILPPPDLFLLEDQFFGKVNDFAQIWLSDTPIDSQHQNTLNFNTQALPDLSIVSRAENPLENLCAWMASHPNTKILFCAESAGRREMLRELLARIKLNPTVIDHWQEALSADNPFTLTVLPIQSGFYLPDQSWACIAEAEFFGQQVMQRRYRKKTVKDQDAPVRNLVELKHDSPIVHIDHGVGRYKGLVTLTIADHTGEYLMIEYADQDKLYVPVGSLHLISQYSATHIENAPLHKLGTEQWEKAKKKAAKRAFDVAAELLDVQAKRTIKQGAAFKFDPSTYFQFSSQFPFEETPDQSTAIEAVIEDMQNTKAMDRLVCGDVGFGKTEVALRAAFLCVENQKQVVVLVPTTLLAQQHYETFCDRFADWPVRIEVLSRFRTGKEQTAVLKDLKSGRVDIVIGTHKLLNEDIAYHKLGLVVVDEEHRFGVRQKEKLKALRAEVDLLTLTATPIPRTMNMALATLRDLSIIATPPAKRRSIKTFVRETNRPLILEAIQRELMRGGQVYYLHNNVDTIEKTTRELQEALPQARIGFAHGQMRERQLEQIMSDFYHQRFHVLVCTTIIETGIDIPSANTIIIDRADKFGLAQLHQLRGRVGRSHHQAYAYCLTPPKKMLTGDAEKRLEAISNLDELGAGFTLATHDLEIRGAGELLGEEQSGNMHAIGFSLYMEILERTVASLKAGKGKMMDMPLHHGAEIDLQMPALIPEDYIPDVHSRLVLYKRIANANDQAALHELQVEMIDRFGLLPEPTINLFKVTELKLLAQPIGIRKIDASEKGGKFIFEDSPNIDTDKIIAMIRDNPRQFKLAGSAEVRFFLDMPTPEERLQKVTHLVNQLL